MRISDTMVIEHYSNLNHSQSYSFVAANRLCIVLLSACYRFVYFNFVIEIN